MSSGWTTVFIAVQSEEVCRCTDIFSNCPIGQEIPCVMIINYVVIFRAVRPIPNKCQYIQRLSVLALKVSFISGSSILNRFPTIEALLGDVKDTDRAVAKCLVKDLLPNEVSRQRSWSRCYYPPLMQFSQPMQNISFLLLGGAQSFWLSCTKWTEKPFSTHSKKKSDTIIFN